VVDHGAGPHARGYVPVDDEGVCPRAVVLVDRGEPTGALLHSLDTAALLEQEPTGNGRAVDVGHRAIPRLRTLELRPGQASLDELLQSADAGLYATGFHGGQTDRDTFSLIPAGVRRIRRGRLGPVVSPVTMLGSIAGSWSALAGIGGESWTGDTSAACGKLGQWPLATSSWAPPVLIRSLRVEPR
ncbi:MAG: metallopeptidase TldD-related protein, partial [Phycicoccus sp.]